MPKPIMLQPSLTLERCCSSWLLLEGKAYPVATCKPAHFKAFVQALNPLQGNEVEEMINQDELDELERWYVLNALAEQKISYQLYASEEQALKATMKKKRVIRKKKASFSTSVNDTTQSSKAVSASL